MASVKLKFVQSKSREYGWVYFQIIHERKVRCIKSSCLVADNEWIQRRSTVVDGSMREQLRNELDRIKRVIKNLEDKDLPYTVDDVVYDYRRYVEELSLSAFMGQLIIRLKTAGKIRTAETYVAALNSVTKFLKGHDVMLDLITPRLVEDYQDYLRTNGLIPNSTSFYMRILRAVYNRAVDRGLVEQHMPFKNVYTGVDKTIKRAIPISVLKKIKALDLARQPRLDYARDMFLMSFYLRGMSFIDMAFLRKADLRDGFVTYRRRKTGQQLVIKWTNEMQLIVGKYPKNETDYLLPIVRKKVVSERSAYRNAGCAINAALKKIAALVGLSIPLTLYVARHSWASAAKVKGVSISVISQGMGHDSETTTQIYLASLDTSVIDKANALIIASI